MLRYRFFILLWIITFYFSSCNNDEPIPVDKPQSTSINKIMALGASRVEGARPAFESFRYELWKQLIDGGYKFDYIGTMSDPAAYPDFLGLNFDVDHEGRGGWTSGQILANINNWLMLTGAPDIVLFSSPGGNDALQGLSYNQVISNINDIIDTIQASNPNVTIIIEQLAPARSDLMTTELANYFNQIQQDVISIAAQQSTSDSKVITVDMATGFKDSFLADDVHYNETGARFIANQYYNVLINILD